MRNSVKLAATRSALSGARGVIGALALMVGVLCVTLGTTHAQEDKVDAATSANPPLVLRKFGSFFVGGRDIPVPYRSGFLISPTYEETDTVKIDQMYVQYMIPWSKRHRLPVVFAHGAWHTGKTWEETPDGREGWVNFFVRQGFATYWVDKPWRGRSAFNAQLINAVARGDAPPSALPNIYVTGHKGWVEALRLGPSFGELFPKGLFPLAAAEQYLAQLVPDFSVFLRGSPTPRSYPMLEEDVGALLNRIGRAIYIGHSQGGGEIPGLVRAHPNLFAAAISVEGGCPPIEDAALYKNHGIPFALVTGDYTTPSADCQAFIDALNGMGGRAANLWLPALGIHGNDHMMMLDRNNKIVARVIINWIKRVVEGGRR
jgi:pimeloyl-ACP methyl ester carboxylesterase